MNIAGYFSQHAQVSPDPWKTLLERVAVWINQDTYFNNFLIEGDYTDLEPMSAGIFAVIGLAPDTPRYLFYFLGSCSESEKEHNRRRLARLAAKLNLLPPAPFEKMDALRPHLHRLLGANEFHCLGMISIHEAILHMQEAAFLWTNARLKRSGVEKILKSLITQYCEP